jgi:hypothetical protein
MPDPGQGSTKKAYSRALEIGLNSLKFQDRDGGLLIKDVPLLAEGTWTDSNVGTPARYRGEVLEQFAGAWRDQSVWSRHAGGVPRSITEKIGTVIDPHYQDRAVVGDLFLHGQNTQSRDTIEMVKADLAEFVSVEHIGAEMWNPEENVYDVISLEFLGLAIVNKGACKKCRLNEEDVRYLGYVPNNPKGYGTADEKTPWSRPNLGDFTDRSWDDLSQEEKAAIASHFAYVENLDSFAGLKLPHHDPKTHNAVWKGVAAAMAALGGARGGSPVPSDMKEKVRAHLEGHYRDFDKELEEDDMDSKELEEMKGQVKALSEALAKSEGERKELTTKVAELEAARKANEDKLKQLAELEARVKELEESPADPKANLGDGQDKELAEPDTPEIVIRSGVMMMED